ncbi:sphingolipid 10-desaturase isoform X2 [Lingula anatina]|nr:sphingolipid 10-desaturase isoform X2 [Lingula anatina]XP_013413398.1 sphingolipid 10-desaturase isoform X2 [Lingula anatina]|eukprot:XP_013413397.1 sphingolipid 10-desaturase isoform X2 [Lingula anatina]
MTLQEQEMSSSTSAEVADNKPRSRSQRTISVGENNNQVNRKASTHQDQGERKLIGIDGKWYDITTFIPHHPGGDIIKHFIGRDATAVFHSFHERDVLKHRKPVGDFELDEDPATEAFRQLQKFFIENGYFETSMLWYAGKFAITFCLLALSFLCVIASEKWYVHYLGAFFLASFWHQCGFFMHDFMHTQGFHKAKIDRWLGTFFGTVCLGVSGSWWREEHFSHHALTNTVNPETKWSDPQAHEAIFAQNERLFPLHNSLFEYYAIKVQHITFLPTCILFGRVAIILDSFREEKNVREWVAFVIHWTWICLLLSFLPSWYECLVFYSMAAIFEGVLHIQLLISHYCKPFYLENDICTTQNWYRMQVISNINIVNPVWMDWFHGGLNFHIEHHLFPLMPRHNYRKANKHVKHVCKELGITFDECTWSEAVIRTIQHLKKMSTHFSLNPN